MIRLVLFLFCLLPFISNAQIVVEKITLDTVVQSIQVIYQPTENSHYYHKKIAVFAADTSQIAIEKSYTNYGQNGIYKVYYPSGRLKIKTVYANDKINGEWTWYDQNGVILVKGIYKDGIKSGFWAYKSLKIYGKYSKGKRNGRWYLQNPNQKKVKSFYKKGVLVKGSGFGNEEINMRTIDSSGNHQEVITNNTNVKVNSEYDQAITALIENFAVKKALKEHFAHGDLKVMRGLKKFYQKGKFQFAVAPVYASLDIASFLTESKNGKIVSGKIDSVLKAENVQWINSISKDVIFKENKPFYELSSNKESTMVVYFSNIENNVLRIDVLKLEETFNADEANKTYLNATKNQMFKILFYFEDGKLKGAEYEKP